MIFLLFIAYTVFAQTNNEFTMCKDFYKFEDYYMSAKYAKQVLKGKFTKSEKEEALYYLNESAEELALEIGDKAGIISDAEIKSELKKYKENCDINIIIEQEGYNYKVYYDKWAFKKLTKKYPKSKFIERIKLRHLIRISKYIINPVYRFKKNLTILKKYNKYVQEYPNSYYLPDLLLRIADINLNLYYEAPIVAKHLVLSKKEIDDFYETAKNIYKEITIKYPDSEAAMLVGIITMNNVKLREEPKTKSKVIMKLRSGTLVKIIDRTDKKVGISNMYDYWYLVKVPEGMTGWIYGFYLQKGLR